MARDGGTLVVDSHNHFWDIERSELYWLTPDVTALQRSYTPPDLKPEMDAVGVDRSVIVQAASSRWDNLWWLELAEEYPYIGGVVGYVELENSEAGALLDEYGAHPAFRGVRATAEDQPDPDWLSRAEVLRGIGKVAARGMTLDLLVCTQHLTHVPRLAKEFPELPMVVDHLAKPPIAAGRIDEWMRGMEALVQYPNIWVKVSGLLTEAGPEPSAERIEPVVRFALDAFGPERLMWGSDWPVCTLAADYQTTYRTVNAALGTLSETDRARVFGGSAIEFYRLA